MTSPAASNSAQSHATPEPPLAMLAEPETRSSMLRYPQHHDASLSPATIHPSRSASKVEDTWAELAAASPHPAILEEGRIVLAGAKADQGRLQDAVRILEQANRSRPRKPKLHHLRSWYALADLYERAGMVGNARRLFADIAAASPGFGDAGKRAASLK